MGDDAIRRNNKQLIERRLKDGLALLREYYMVEERDLDPQFTHPVVGGTPCDVRSFDIWDVGNLLMMSATEAQESQIGTFVITPFYKNLPLFSTDYVYTETNRIALVELYDLSVRHDDLYNQGIASFAAFSKEWDNMPTYDVQPSWHDEIRPVCIARKPSCAQDEQALWQFREALHLFIKMERTAPMLSDVERMQKWKLNKGYSDRLIDEGGVAADRWTSAFGPENTRRFFDEAFFGCAYYAE